MGKVEVPDGWEFQGFVFALDCPARRVRRLASHVGAARFAYNWALQEIEQRIAYRNVQRRLAWLQGATPQEADAWVEQLTPLKWDQIWLRRLFNEVKDEVAPWWPANSKEVYSNAFANLADAFKNYYKWRDGGRRGRRVGWPQYKRKGRDDPGATFSTGAIHVLDRHHIQLPRLGALRTLEPTDQLRLKIDHNQARILDATAAYHDARWHVAFNVICLKDLPQTPPAGGPQGHDVGIRQLVTSSDGRIAPNPRTHPRPVRPRRVGYFRRAERERQERQAGTARARDKIGRDEVRLQRKLDRQHRTGSPRCFGPDGQHITGHCYWNDRSKRSRETQRQLQKLQAHGANMQRDAVHKTSHRLATQNLVNVLECLFVAGIVGHGRGKRGFNRAAQQANLALLGRQMGYKHRWYHGVLLLADRWFPSSKTCSRCHHINRQLKRSDTVFRCLEQGCGLVLDRDLNAARNLEWLAQLAGLVLLCQMSTGVPVDWSVLPVRPWGWQPPRPDRTRSHTRSSRGSARAHHHPAGMAGGGDVRHPSSQPPAGPATALSFDREDRRPPQRGARPGGRSESVTA